jgi:hypothetical protein
MRESSKQAPPSDNRKRPQLFWSRRFPVSLGELGGVFGRVGHAGS